VTLCATVAAVPVFVTATAATVSNVGLPATLPVLPRPPIEQVVVAEIVLQEIDDAPLCEVLVSPSPSNEPLTVYFVCDVALFVPSPTEMEKAPLPENGTVKVALTAPVLEGAIESDAAADASSNRHDFLVALERQLKLQAVAEPAEEPPEPEPEPDPEPAPAATGLRLAG